MVYGCDAPWWRYRRGLPEFTGIKVTWSGNDLSEYPDIRKVEIAKDARGKYAEGMQFDRPCEVIGGGGNSGFQALNLAVQMGARRIILIGYDMTDSGRAHWYGRNGWKGANNPDSTNYRRWMKAFESARPVLDGMGVEVVNVSPITALKAFPRRSIEDALKGWE